MHISHFSCTNIHSVSLYGTHCGYGLLHARILLCLLKNIPVVRSQQDKLSAWKNVTSTGQGRPWTQWDGYVISRRLHDFCAIRNPDTRSRPSGARSPCRARADTVVAECRRHYSWVSVTHFVVCRKRFRLLRRRQVITAFGFPARSSGVRWWIAASSFTANYL